jgi:DNA adenine methylase
MGGKTRIGKEIANVIQSYSPHNYAEPFCGMFSVGRHVCCKKKYASDINPDLILLLQAIQSGWEPPGAVSEEQYNELKHSPSSALRGFVGFGCSFYGKFFGGYARERDRDFTGNARSSLLKLAPDIKDVVFTNTSYVAQEWDVDLIYCDPPYASTTDFGTVFNTEEFWEWVRSRKEVVLISEYVAPSDFDIVWEKKVVTDMKSKTGRGCDRVERLFTKKT